MPKFYVYTGQGRCDICPLASMQCSKIKEDGQRCRNKVVMTNPYCWIHSLELFGVQVKESRAFPGQKGLFAMKAKYPNNVAFRKERRTRYGSTPGDIICPYYGEIEDANPADINQPYAVKLEGNKVVNADCYRSLASNANSATGTRFTQNAEIAKAYRDPTSLTGDMPVLDHLNAPTSGRSYNYAVLRCKNKNIKVGDEIFVDYGRDYRFQDDHTNTGYLRNREQAERKVCGNRRQQAPPPPPPPPTPAIEAPPLPAPAIEAPPPPAPAIEPPQPNESLTDQIESLVDLFQYYKTLIPPEFATLDVRSRYETGPGVYNYNVFPMFYTYLMAKFKNKCSFVYEPESLTGATYISPVKEYHVFLRQEESERRGKELKATSNFSTRTKGRSRRHVPSIENIINDCKRRGITNILIPTSVEGDLEVDQGWEGHQILLYLTKREGKWITFVFDPNGIRSMVNCDDCVGQVSKTYKNEMFCQICKDFENVQTPSTFCYLDGGGPQQYDERGMCQYWSLLMVYLLLKFPNATPEEVIHAMGSKFEAKKLMNGFVTEVWKYFNSKVKEHEREKGHSGGPDFYQSYQPTMMADVRRNITMPIIR